MRVGESNVNFPIDTLAGTPGMITTAQIAASVCTLVVRQLASRGFGDEISRVVVPAERVVPNGDNRTFTYVALAGDFPVAGPYELQLIATSTDGQTVRISLAETIVVDDTL